MFGYSTSTIIALAIILFVAFPVHELAHAYTATAFGDDTPRQSGRLSFNPISHWDLFGTLMLILTKGFGWAKPVPINPYRLERTNSLATMWVSLAGPLSNLAMAILVAIPWRLGLISAFNQPNTPPYWIAQVSYQFIVINLALLLFNLIPLAPLDGEKVLFALLPPNMQRGFETIRPYSPVILLVILFALPYVGIDIFGAILWPALDKLVNLLIGI